MEQDPESVQEVPDEVVDQAATVTTVEAMDESRVDEVEAVLSEHWDTVSEQVDVGEPDDLGGWQRVADDVAEAGDERTAEKIDTLVDRAERSRPSLLRLRLAPQERELSFDPGQYVRVSFADKPPRVYSIASSPNEAELELCITRVPSGHLTPSLMDDAECDDEMFVRGPYGKELSLFDESDRDMVFVATGTGVAPLRSMIRYTFEESLDSYDGERRDVWLFLGASWRDDLPYHAEFETLADEHENFHYVPTVSREQLLHDWAGETDYVQQTLLKYLADAVDRTALPESLEEYFDVDPEYDVDVRVDPESAELYVCGVGPMCDSVTDVTEALGLKERVTKVESYG